MFNRNGNTEKNYHSLQALNCVEYKDNRIARETTRSWACKAGCLFCCCFFFNLRFCRLKFHQNKDTRRYFTQPASDAVSTSFNAPNRNY